MENPQETEEQTRADIKSLGILSHPTPTTHNVSATDWLCLGHVTCTPSLWIAALLTSKSEPLK